MIAISENRPSPWPILAAIWQMSDAQPERWYNAVAAVERAAHPRQGVLVTTITPPRRIVWSTDRVDLADPFQRQWYLRQVLTYGRAEDIAGIDLEEVARLLEALDLPPHVHSLWAYFLESRSVAR